MTKKVLLAVSNDEEICTGDVGVDEQRWTGGRSTTWREGGKMEGQKEEAAEAPARTKRWLRSRMDTHLTTTWSPA